jgi:ribosomal protein S18 acetylase RimI-like enzyme
VELLDAVRPVFESCFDDPWFIPPFAREPARGESEREVVWERRRSVLERWISDDGVLVAAGHDGRFVGYSVVRMFNPGAADAVPIAILEDLGVDPAHRNGLGMVAMMSMCRRELVRRGIQRWTTQLLPENTIMIDILTRIGGVPTAVTYSGLVPPR